MENSVSEVKISKRVIAYLLDILLVLFVVTLVTSIRFINPHYDKYLETYEKYSSVLEEYYNGDINENEMIKLNNDNYYYLTKYSISYNIAIMVVLILYYVFFQKYNRGATLGKQIMKIKVVNVEEKKDVSILNYLIRALFSFYIYVGSIIPLVLSTILVFIIKASKYMLVNTIISYIFLLFAIINFSVMCIRKDRRGIHEIISKTKVINQ